MFEQIAVIVLLVASTLALAAEPEPLHVWHFDEASGGAVLDASPDFVDLELRGGATRVEGRFGAAVQTGDGGYVQGRGLGMIATGAVEAWVKLLEAAAGGQFGLIGFGNEFGDKNDMALLGIFPGPEGGPGGRFGFGICPGTWRGVSAEPPSLNEWHHLAANWGPLGMELFIDGERVAQEDAPAALPSHAAIFLVASSWGRTVKAVIDEVRVYAEPLPAEIVAQHVADVSYVAQPPAPEKRVIHYGAAEGADLSAADFASDASFTGGIQEAIDALPRAGGEVYVPPGTLPAAPVDLVARQRDAARGGRGDGPATRARACHADHRRRGEGRGERAGRRLIDLRGRAGREHLRRQDARLVLDDRADRGDRGQHDQARARPQPRGRSGGGGGREQLVPDGHRRARA